MDVLSYALSKKYTNEQINEQKLKVAKLEQELNNYKSVMSQVNINQEATQKATGYGIVSLPPNAAEGQVSVVVKGRTATNLVKNGNFANTQSWNTNNIMSVANNVLTLLCFTQYGSVYQTVDIKQGIKYYIRALVKTDTPNVKLLLSRDGGYSFIVVPHSGSGSYELLSGVGSTLDAIVAPRISIMDYRTAEYTEINVKEVILVDLTSMFGAGNEPSKEECDKIFANWFDGTKSTLGAIRFVVGRNLLRNSNELVETDDYLVKSYYLTEDIEEGEIVTISLKGELGEGKKRFGIYNSSDSASAVLTNLYPEDRGKDGVYRKTFTWKKYSTNSFINVYQIPASVSGVTSTIEWIKLEKGTQESTLYVLGKDEEGNILELHSLPNGVKDEINVSEGKLIKRVSDEVVLQGSDFIHLLTSNINNDVVSVNKSIFVDIINPGTDTMATKVWTSRTAPRNGASFDSENNVWTHSFDVNNSMMIFLPKGLYADLASVREDLAGTTLIYQLAEPIIIPVQVSGNLVTYPSGTIYIEPVVADAGIYTSNGITILHQELPIDYIEKISKIDFETGIETELDTSQAVISEDGTYFTHPELVEGDIVFFEYYYPSDMTTQGETDIEYYDSRYVIQDSVTGQFYKWTIAVADGVPSIQLQEV